MIGGHSALNCGFEVTADGNQDVDGDNDEGKYLEPLGLADPPLVLEHHEAHAADGSGVELCVMEPTVHIQVGGIVQGPLGTHCGTDGDGDEVHRQTCGQNEEEENTALFGSSGQLICENQAQEYQQPAEKLIACKVSVNLEKHCCNLLI